MLAEELVRALAATEHPITITACVVVLMVVWTACSVIRASPKSLLTRKPRALHLGDQTRGKKMQVEKRILVRDTRQDAEERNSLKAAAARLQGERCSVSLEWGTVVWKDQETARSAWLTGELITDAKRVHESVWGQRT